MPPRYQMPRNQMPRNQMDTLPNYVKVQYNMYILRSPYSMDCLELPGA